MNKALFKLPFDQFGRYYNVSDFINSQRKGEEKFKILDVGGGTNFLLAKFLPDDEIIVLDTHECEKVNYIKGDALKISFEDEYFDFVISCDVFEHIKEEDREKFINEQIRIAKKYVILGAPFYSPEVVEAENIANAFYKGITGKDYIWLKEHIENGLPSEESLEKTLKQKNLSFKKISNNSLALWVNLIKLNLISSLFLPFQEKIEAMNIYYNKEKGTSDYNELSYRKIYFISKNKELPISNIQNKNSFAVENKVFLASNQLLDEITIAYIKQKDWEMKKFLNNYKHIENELESIWNSRIFKTLKIVYHWKWKILKIFFKFKYKVSIIIPVYNHAQYLDEVIISALSQELPATEIIIVDDCSPDPEVKKILQKYEAQKNIKIFYSKENGGISKTQNKAIKKSKGNWIAFLDCDDILLPHALKESIEFLNKNPQFKYVSSLIIDITPEGNIIQKREPRAWIKNIKETLLKSMEVGHFKVIHRSVFKKVGLFNKKFDFCQDYEFALRASEHFEIGLLDKHLYKYRIHNNNISISNNKKQNERAQEARKEAHQRRGI